MNRYLTIPEEIRWAKKRRPEMHKAPGFQRSRIASGICCYRVGFAKACGPACLNDQVDVTATSREQCGATPGSQVPLLATKAEWEEGNRRKRPLTNTHSAIGPNSEIPYEQIPGSSNRNGAH